MDVEANKTRICIEHRTLLSGVTFTYIIIIYLRGVCTKLQKNLEGLYSKSFGEKATRGIYLWQSQLELLFLTIALLPLGYLL